MRLLVVATMKGDIASLWGPIASSFLESFGDLPVVKEVDGGNIRGKVELEIEKKDFDRFLENFRNLGKLIASRDSGVQPETNWCDLETAPVDHIRALIFD